MPELKGLISSSSGNHRAVHGIGVSSGMAIAKAWYGSRKWRYLCVNLKHSDEPELAGGTAESGVLQVQMDLDALAMRFQDAVQVDSSLF